jgi:hypothetical protein
MKYTTHLELHSQTTRLVERVLASNNELGIYGILTLYDPPFQGTYPDAVPKTPSAIYNSDRIRSLISNLSSCRFTRRY